jgi:hypothetical protein
MDDVRRPRCAGRARAERVTVVTAVLVLATACLGLTSASRAHAQQTCTPDMIVQQKKDSAVAWWQRGTELYRQERYQESIESYQRAYDCAVLLPPSDRVTETAANFVFNIAQAHRQLGECAAAIQGYRRYLAMTEPLTRNEQVRDVRAAVTVTLDELEKHCPAPEEPRAEATSPPAQPAGSAPDTHRRAGPETAEPVTTAPPVPADAGAGVAQARPPGASRDHGAASEPSRVSVAIALGPAFVDTRGLDVPIRPSFALRAGYPMQTRLLDVELGVAATYMPVRWRNPDFSASGTAALWSLLLNAGASQPLLSSRLSARVDLGLGVLTFSGLGMHNPFTIDGVPSGPLTMLDVRVELGVAYALTPKLVLSASPLVLSYSAPDEALNDSVGRLTRYEMLFGAGYRL